MVVVVSGDSGGGDSMNNRRQAVGRKEGGIMCNVIMMESDNLIK